MRDVLRVRSVDDEGLHLLAVGDRPVDVCFDGRRVWTFWTWRDTVPTRVVVRGRSPVRTAVWPEPMRHHLRGATRLTLRDSRDGSLLHDAEVVLGADRPPPKRAADQPADGTPRRIAVRNAAGVDLGIDKSGRLVPTFEGRSETDIASLMDAVERVIAALREAGLEPIVAYGTLLGAVREGAVIGHDSDADLGYVSRFTDPVDVSRESFAVQRRLVEQGWRISRYSGAGFKIFVTEGEVTRGLDVFGGFYDAGRLYLTGEVGVDFDLDWFYPLGTATLEGREVPVPARPEKLLEAMYGEGWRTPDPAYKFETPARTVRAFNEWFRGLRPALPYWERRSFEHGGRPQRREPSLFARRAVEMARRLDGEVLDVGAGRGRDSLWIARQGVEVTAYDFVPRALTFARRRAEEESLPLTVREVNLTEWRSVFAEGAWLAHRPRPRVVLANHVMESTSAAGREGLARLCSMALREGGFLLAQFYVPPEGFERVDDLEWVMGRPDVDTVVELVRAAGAREVRVKHDLKAGHPVVRLIGEW